MYAKIDNGLYYEYNVYQIIANSLHSGYYYGNFDMSSKQHYNIQAPIWLVNWTKFLLHLSKICFLVSVSLCTRSHCLPMDLKR